MVALTCNSSMSRQRQKVQKVAGLEANSWMLGPEPSSHEQQNYVISIRLKNQQQIYLYSDTKLSWILLITVNCESSWDKGTEAAQVHCFRKHLERTK